MRRTEETNQPDFRFIPKKSLPELHENAKRILKAAEGRRLNQVCPAVLEKKKKIIDLCGIQIVSASANVAQHKCDQT